MPSHADAATEQAHSTLLVMDAWSGDNLGEPQHDAVLPIFASFGDALRHRRQMAFRLLPADLAVHNL